MTARAVLVLIRHSIALALLALALPAAAQTSTPVAQPVAQSPPPATAPIPARIVAVGDLHGDYSAWIDIASGARLVDAAGHWSGGRTTLVQLGDITDRGPNSLKIIRSLQRLAAEAPRSGGEVVVLLGNHEAMNLLGDLRYTSAAEFAAFADRSSVARREQAYARQRRALEAEASRSDPDILPSQVRANWLARTPLGWVEHRAAWSPAGELGRWASRNPAIWKIGDSLFAHGGISAEFARSRIDDINRRVATAMRIADDRPASILRDPLGPLWYRGLVMRDADAETERRPGRRDSAAELTEVLAAYGARRLVIGHTPTLTGIGMTDGGRLLRIDTGISSVYGGPLTWLEITGAKVTPHTVKRSVP